MKITRITGKEIFDSRGMPTVACEIELETGQVVGASVPTGTSRSTYEAKNLYDGGDRFFGFGVQNAVQIIDTIIAPELLGNEPNVVQMDTFMLELDKTDDKSRLGANSILAVSMAICKAQALLENLELYELIAFLCDFESVSLPCPMFNMINGGMHAHNKLSIQEFMLMPIGMSNFRSSFELGATLFQMLQKELLAQDYFFGFGLEGGLSFAVDDNRKVLDIIMKLIKKVESMYGGTIMIVLDIAASQFYNHRQKQYEWNGKSASAEELIEWYSTLLNEYPIYAIEDPLDEDDWAGWKAITNSLGKKVHIIGDDIFATHPELIWQGIEADIMQGVVIKPNQIATVTESLQAIKLCKEYDKFVVASHRSGETNDTFIADLAVGVGANYIKAGGCSHGERMAKYNRLLSIEDDLLLTF